MTAPNRDGLAGIAQAGREAIRRLWARRDEKATMARPERRLVDLLEDHLEFRECWEGTEPDGEQNPFLHVTFHELLDRQLREDDPPAVRQTLERLVAAGRDRHEALHEIMRILVFHLHQMMSGGTDFDLAAYEAALTRLDRPEPDPG